MCGGRAGQEQGSGGDGLADADLCDRGLGGEARAGRPGAPGRALVLRSRCRCRSVSTRRRARLARTRSRPAVIAGVGRLAVAVPALVVAVIARRAAVKEIWRGWTGWQAPLPLLPAGTAIAAAARAMARASSTAVTQAACSWAIECGDWERSIAPVDGPAPLIADLASFSAVSDPIHRQ